MLIPLKKYINNWLDTYTVKDIFTGEIQKARDIFSWNKSYFLKLLIQDKYYIDTDIDYVTKNQNYLKIIKKPLSQITPKKVKKYRKIGEQRIIDRYVTEKVIDYEPIEVRRYRLIDDYNRPIYDTVIKKRKIGKKYYLTTEYIETGKYRKKRQYFNDIEYVRVIKTKKRPIYKTVEIFEPYWEQERQRQPEDIKTQIETHRFYEPFFVFDYYKKLSEDEYEHYLYISPFFDGYGTAVKIGSDDDEIVNNRRLPKFISPQELTKTQMYLSAYRQCRYMIINGKQRLRKKYFKEITDKINNDDELHTINMRDSNLYSLDILKVNGSGIIFFKATDINGNTSTKIV